MLTNNTTRFFLHFLLVHAKLQGARLFDTLLAGGHEYLAPQREACELNAFSGHALPMGVLYFFKLISLNSSAIPQRLEFYALYYTLVGIATPAPEDDVCLMRFAVQLFRSRISLSLLSNIPCRTMSSSKCAALMCM
eukprot:6213872-Pleurochrysis_carterae.AAC.1